MLPIATVRTLVRTLTVHNTRHGQERQLLVDVSVTLRQDARSGIQRAVRAWLGALQAHPPAGFCVRPIFATHRHNYRYAPDLTCSTQQLENAQPVIAEPGDVFLGIDLVAHLLPRWQFQLLQWKAAGVQIDIVVHDLLPLLHPEWFNPKTVRNFGRWAQVLAKYADHLICTSQSVAKDVSHWKANSRVLRQGEARIYLAPLGADILASSPSQGLRPEHHEMLRQLSNQEIVLIVGTVEPRKGHAIALDAMEELWSQGRTTVLVIVGRPGWKTKDLQQRLRTHPEHGERLLWIDDASDEMLGHLYVLAKGVLNPSLGEGFGLPLVEAMYHNCSLLARNLDVFREIAGEQIEYFDDDTSQALAKRIAQWLDNIPLHKRPPYNVRTWEESASDLRRLYADRPASPL
ncbi:MULTISPECIES: glycosyltransferase family 4 protein [Paraburkholderia]|nr:glycosyltransferase family 1 protein [Paraburkholderia podalyriae]